MIKGIVYTSNSGFTKEYAKMLSKRLSISAYSLKESQKILCKNDEIIYMGWIMANIIKGYKKANKKYNIKVLCAVGMKEFSEEVISQIKTANGIGRDLFYLQGGFDMNRLSGVYKFFMMGMLKGIEKELKETFDKSKGDMLSILKEGKSFISDKNLDEIESLCKNSLI